ncbi:MULTISPECIES: DUF6783 domain-containing protein [unclassified Blautia]
MFEKSPINCDAYLVESLFQTRSRVTQQYGKVNER